MGRTTCPDFFTSELVCSILKENKDDIQENIDKCKAGQELFPWNYSAKPYDRSSLWAHRKLLHSFLVQNPAAVLKKTHHVQWSCLVRPVHGLIIKQR